jgi:RND superfamily putative drug exporter
MGAWSARHRKTAVFGWLLFVVLATVLGSVSGSHQITNSEQMPGQVARASQILDQAGIKTPAGETVLVQNDTLTADDAAFHAKVDQVVAAVNGTGKAADLRSPYDTRAISADRHSVLVQFNLPGTKEEAADKVTATLAAVASVQKADTTFTVEEYGEATAGKWIGDQFKNDFASAEWTAVPLALGILLIAFGAVVAAVLPVGLALTAFIAAGGLVALSSRFLHTSDDASSVMLLVGLAVGVDYCLFYLRREREERAAGRTAADALKVAAATSGRAVLVSGITAVITTTMVA